MIDLETEIFIDYTDVRKVNDDVSCEIKERMVDENA